GRWSWRCRSTQGWGVGWIDYTAGRIRWHGWGRILPRRRDANQDGASMRVIIAEDNALLREGLVTVLAKFDITVVNAVDTADGLLEAVQEMLYIDVIITDIRMPPTFTTERLEAAVRLREEYPRLPVLVLSQFVEQFYARELIASGDGAVGYLLKDRVLAVAEFVDAVR